VHAFAHVTGGGLAANLARVLPPGTGATVDRGTWCPPAIFSLLAGHGGIGQGEMERVFNMGVGMVAVVGANDADGAFDLVNARGIRAWPVGEVTSGGEGVRLVPVFFAVVFVEVAVAVNEVGGGVVVVVLPAFADA